MLCSNSDKSGDAAGEVLRCLVAKLVSRDVRAKHLGLSRQEEVPSRIKMVIGFARHHTS
jgi:hypothetical protein